jgi:diguanylate cyclase (GGDEF)-like protein
MMLILSHRLPTIRIAAPRHSDFQATAPAVDESPVPSPTRVALAREWPDRPDRPVGGRDAQLLAPWAPRERQTPMPQRWLFRQRLEEALAFDGGAVHPLALLVIDVEGLAPVAQAHGRDAGDLALQIIAERLGRAVRSGDVINRIGFQEFGGLLSGAFDRHQLGHLADKLCVALTAPLRVGTLWLHVYPSVGIAHGAARDAGAAGMMLGASGAMLRAKQQRSGYAFFDPPSWRPVRRGGSVMPMACEAAPEPTPEPAPGASRKPSDHRAAAATAPGGPQASPLTPTRP